MVLQLQQRPLGKVQIRKFRSVAQNPLLDKTFRFLGALTKNSQKLANFAGFYKGVQSAGGAVSFRINTLADLFVLNLLKLIAKYENMGTVERIEPLYFSSIVSRQPLMLIRRQSASHSNPLTHV